MAEPDDLFTAQYVLRHHLTTGDQLRACLLTLAAERRLKPEAPPRPLGRILVDSAVIDDKTLHKILARRADLPGDPTAPDHELGKLLVQAGAASATQVSRCLKLQAEARRAGTPVPRLGEMLVEQGFTNARQLTRALSYHGKTTFVCIGCNKRYSIVNARPDTTYTCPKCRTELIMGTELAKGETAVTRAVSATVTELSTFPDDLDEQFQADRAMCVSILGKEMATAEAVREAIQVQTDLMRFGDFVPLLDVLRQLNILTAQHADFIAKTDWPDLIKTPDWLRQPPPRYRVTGRLAIGTGSALLDAESTHDDRRASIKMFHTDRAKDGNAVKRFARTSDLLIRLTHSSLLKGVEYGTLVTRRENVEVPYLIMEGVVGESLEQVLMARGALPSASALRIALDVAEGLAYLRAQGLAHGDVRPEHIVVDARGRARLCDLGPAPKAEGERDAAVTADLYCLALTLHAMLAGLARIPEVGILESMGARASSLAAPNVDVLQAPGPVLTILARMVDRTERYTSYGDLIAEMKRLVATM